MVDSFEMIVYPMHRVIVLREQARSHKGALSGSIFVNTKDPMWERACSGRRSDEGALKSTSILARLLLQVIRLE
ncbi:hypothetical protein D3C87_1960300 [compost metagenome]